MIAQGKKMLRFFKKCAESSKRSELAKHNQKLYTLVVYMCTLVLSLALRNILIREAINADANYTGDKNI